MIIARKAVNEFYIIDLKTCKALSEKQICIDAVHLLSKITLSSWRGNLGDCFQK